LASLTSQGVVCGESSLVRQSPPMVRTALSLGFACLVGCASEIEYLIVIVLALFAFCELLGGEFFEQAASGDRGEVDRGSDLASRLPFRLIERVVGAPSKLRRAVERHSPDNIHCILAREADGEATGEQARESQCEATGAFRVIDRLDIAAKAIALDASAQ